jgi:hypothetical protein
MNYFSQLLNVHMISDVREIEIHTAEPLVPGPSLLDTAEPLVPGPSLLEVEIANEKFKM